MPVIILGGIYGGIFTPTETLVVAVVYALIASLGICRELSSLRAPADDPALYTLLRDHHVHHLDAGVSFVLTGAGIRAAIKAWIVESFDSDFAFLLAVNAFLFLIGMLVETSASIVVIGAPRVMFSGLSA